MMHISFLSKILFFALLWPLSGCTLWREPAHEKPHVIVIAIESLNFENASCSDRGEEQQLFLEICQESMRFTHFYTSSTLSQPALASLLTGVDVSEHKVLHNGNVAIPPPMITLPERALQNGYRTALFSGGPPILAKSGFQQGFEVFEDDFLREDSTYMRVGDNLKNAVDWLSELNGPGMVTVYVPDMQFPWHPTFTDEAKEREKSARSQMEEIAESMGWFFKELKARRLWDDAYIVIVGLNGEPSPHHKSVLWRESLFRDNVHVPLFLKTPLPDDANRSVDALLTMKDVGQFLQKVVESKTSDAERVVQQLDAWVESPQASVEVRSDWRLWWFGWAPEVSYRTLDYLVFPKRKATLYHTLVDKNETTPLKESQVSAETLKWLTTRYDESYDKSFELNNDLYNFLHFLRNEKQDKNSQLLDNLPLRNDRSGGVFTLLKADKALLENDWQTLFKTESAIYKFVASKNQPNLEKVTLTHACDKLFLNQKRSNNWRKCRDPLLLALLDWEKRRDSADALFWEKSFMRKYRFYMHYKRIAYMNLFLELNWDVDVANLVGPSLAELYLSLPDKAPLRKKIESYKIPLHVNFL